MAGTRRTYAPWLGRLWVAAAVAGAGYGIFLVVVAVGSPAGAELTGRFPGQPAGKALMAVLLAIAVLWHPVLRERRWLLGAMVCAGLQTVWIAAGAVCFAISQILITAGFFFGRRQADPSGLPATPAE